MKLFSKLSYQLCMTAMACTYYNNDLVPNIDPLKGRACLIIVIDIYSPTSETSPSNNVTGTQSMNAVIA